MGGEQSGKESAPDEEVFSAGVGDASKGCDHAQAVGDGRDEELFPAGVGNGRRTIWEGICSL